MKEILQRIYGIIDVNSFELRSDDFEPVPLRGLFIEAALMAHDCVGNTHITIDNSFKMTVFASIPIKKGQAILYNYTSPLWVRFKKNEVRIYIFKRKVSL